MVIEPLDHCANVVRRILGCSSDPLTALDEHHERGAVAASRNFQELHVVFNWHQELERFVPTNN